MYLGYARALACVVGSACMRVCVRVCVVRRAPKGPGILALNSRSVLSSCSVLEIVTIYDSPWCLYWANIVRSGEL